MGHLLVDTNDNSLDGQAIDIVAVVRSLRDEFDTVEEIFTFTISYVAVYCSSKLTLKNNVDYYYYAIGEDPEQIINLDVDSETCRYTVTITFEGPTTTSIEAVQAQFEHEDPDPTTNDYINIYTKTAQADFIIRTDIQRGTYILTIVYEDDNGMIAQHIKTVEASDLCFTTGLAGIPGDGSKDLTYTIEGAAEFIDFKSITNGDCDIQTLFEVTADPLTALSSYGITEQPILTNMYQAAPIARWEVLQNGGLYVQNNDYGLDGLVLPLTITINSI